MPNIPEIKTRKLDIPEVSTWIFEPSQSLPPIVPVTTNIGLPIVDIPGCVEAHSSKSKSKTIQSDDPNGVLTYCDAGVPSFNPIEFTPEEVIPTRPAKLPPYKKPGEPPKPPQQVDIPKIPEVNTVNCLPDETYNEQLRRCEKNIIEVPSEPDIPWHEEYLPEPGIVIQTSVIAATAAGAAIFAKPIADIVLKAVKPIVKKLVNKIANMRGKKEVVKSVFERRMIQKHLRD